GVGAVELHDRRPAPHTGQGVAHALARPEGDVRVVALIKQFVQRGLDDQLFHGSSLTRTPPLPEGEGIWRPPPQRWSGYIRSIAISRSTRFSLIIASSYSCQSGWGLPAARS